MHPSDIGSQIRSDSFIDEGSPVRPISLSAVSNFEIYKLCTVIEVISFRFCVKIKAVTAKSASLLVMIQTSLGN